MFDHLHMHWQGRFDPGKALPAVARIRPDQLKTGTSPHQGSQHQLGSIPILDVSGMHAGGQEPALGIDEDMPLAPFYLLSSVVAAQPPFWVVLTV